MTDPRRAIPRTDALLAEPRLAAAMVQLGAPAVKDIVMAAQDRARRGELDPALVADAAAAALPQLCSLRPVLNATGVVVHTNLGRAPLSAAAVQAMVAASGYVDVEFDLVGGQRAARGRGALEALLAAVPGAEAGMVTTNGAAALMLVTAALAGSGQEVLISRGEMVEIGDGFRLPELIEATGTRIREVGTTNRTRAADYAGAVGPATAFLLKIHPSNFRIEGFTAAPSTAELVAVGLPVVVDIGSGLLGPDPLLRTEPDAASELSAGAALVTASCDKLLGGPQAGLVLGRRDLVDRVRRHPLARAVRPDKLTLAALEVTLRAVANPVRSYLHADPEVLRRRCCRLAEALSGGPGGPGGPGGGPRPPIAVVASDGAVGGGGGTGVPLPGWALQLPARLAGALRVGDPAVVGRVAEGHLLLDLRCIPPEDDERLLAAIVKVRSAVMVDGRTD